MINVILMIIISVVFALAFAKTIRSWRDGDCCGCEGGKCPACDKSMDQQENEK